jgi:hypothetical protein
MREARYARLQAAAGSRSAAVAKPAERPPVAPPVAPNASTRPAGSGPAEAAVPEPEVATDAVCGHKSMNGRACTREAGHPQKSHRYG